jgi:hypothetical protein
MGRNGHQSAAALMQTTGQDVRRQARITGIANSIDGRGNLTSTEKIGKRKAEATSPPRAKAHQLMRWRSPLRIKKGLGVLCARACSHYFSRCEK